MKQFVNAEINIHLNTIGYQQLVLFIFVRLGCEVIWVKACARSFSLQNTEDFISFGNKFTAKKCAVLIDILAIARGVDFK